MKLKTEMRQKASLSAHMQRCMAILAMDYMELGEYVAEQAMENPIIELADRNVCQEGADCVIRIERERTDEDGAQSMEIAAEENKNRELYFQLSGYRLEPPVRKAAEYIIESLDENGYFTDSIDESAKILGMPSHILREGLRVIKQLEPCGVGAESLEECLMLQLREKYPDETLALFIIQSHLKEYSQGKYEKIATALGTSVSEVRRSGAVIRKLSPKPFHCQGLTQRIRYLTADIVVVQCQGHYAVLPNMTQIPEIHFNSAYLDMLKSDVDDATKQYIRERYEKARWLSDCIAKRLDTLMAVAEIIVKRQENFLRMGPPGLAALKIKDVADELCVHPSTISRTVKNKYVQTRWGIYPLRYFFTGGVKAKEGDISAAQIRDIIWRLIQKEDKVHPYTDSRIETILNDRGIRISRRTIAAYRDQMNIPSSTIRKKML